MRRTLSKPSKPDTKSNILSKPSGKLNLQYLKTLDLIKFPISKFEIRPVKDTTRGKQEEGLKKIVNVFNEMVKRYRKLPADESFSRVISALRKLDQLEQALELFNLIKASANPKFKEQIVGAYSYTAIVQIFQQQIKQANDSSDKLAILANTEKLWEEYRTKKYKLDGHILTAMMGIHASINHYQQAVDLFLAYRGSADLHMYRQYIISLIKMDRLEIAREELDNMKKQYIEKENKRPKDPEAMHSVYDTLITQYFSYKKNQTQAIQVFEEASRSGFYANNQLQKMDNLIKLDFHWGKNYKEGGLPLTVAKVAFLYFMQQVAQQELHVPAKIITGGHIATQAKLKEEFPDYLQTEYDVRVKWDENPKISEFEIPYNEIRKILFIKDGIDYFNKGNYGEAENCYKNLIALEPKHSWSYVQLGWVLHRTERFDEAIAEYERAIALVNSGNVPNQSGFLSEVYRKIGWAYDRKHRCTGAQEDLDKAFKYYEQAIGLNEKNIETYNNWGIGLARIKLFSEAMEKFAIVRDKNIQHDEVCIQLGNCYKQVEKYENAEECYQEAIRRSEKYDEGNSAAWAYQELGDLYYRQYKNNLSNEDFFKHARDAFNICLNLQPTRDQAHQGLAKLYELNGDKEKPKKHHEESDNLLPQIGYSIQHTIMPPPEGSQSPSSSDDDKYYKMMGPRR